MREVYVEGKIATIVSVTPGGLVDICTPNVACNPNTFCNPFNCMPALNPCMPECGPATPCAPIGKPPEPPKPPGPPQPPPPKA